MPSKTLSQLVRLRATYSILVISSYGLLYGLDTAAVAATLPMLKTRFALNSIQMEYLSATSSLGAILGLVIVILVGNRLTRKATLLINTIAYVVGLTMVGVATNFSLCIIGRAIVGVAHGVATMLAPVYVGELSPKEYRGLFISLNSVGINLGMPLGFTLALIMKNDKNCSRWLFIINSSFSLVIAVLLYIFVPNSPRDLIHKGGYDKAKRVIQQLNRPTILSEEQLSKEVKQIIKSINSEGNPKFKDLFTRGNRKALVVSCMLQIGKQLSGFSALQYFSSYLIKIIGLAKHHTSQLSTILLGLVQFLCSAGSLGIIDRLGRRKLLMLSTLSMFIALFVLGGSFVLITGFEQINKPQCADYTHCGSCLLDVTCGWSSRGCVSRSNEFLDNMEFSESCPMNTTKDRIGGWMAVISLIVCLGAMAMGLGSVPWVIQSELFSQSLRSKAGSVASICNWVFSYIMTVSFLELSFAVTLPGVFWLYAVLLLVAILSVYWAVPETAGRTLEDIAEKTNN